MLKQIFQRVTKCLAPNKTTITGIQGSVTINGKTYRGSSIEVVNDEVKVDGKPVEPAESSFKTVSIVVEGSCQDITVNVGDITVKGNVDGEVHTGMGDIECGDVSGDVDDAMGNIDCKNVGGDVIANMGNVTCGTVQGDVSASMGNVYKGRS